MCGIAGFLNLRSTHDDRPARLGRMCDAIRHRGPDDDGNFVDEHVALGMRRLSIIDLSGGQQPMANENGDVHVVFNGEIYNYPALRERLLSGGHQFRTSSDTEVIVHQFEEDGIDCVSQFNGMFAFAVWDQRQQCLYLARDRIGIKPLYYHFDGETLTFASEIKAIIAAGVQPAVNAQAAWDYLSFRYVPPPATIWDGVQKLPPGSILRIDLATGVPSINTYWDLPQPDATEIPENALEEFSNLFLDAVHRRLEAADVPVGVLLSGGLDSSAVAAAAIEMKHKNFHTFCVDFSDGGEFSEARYARELSDALGCQHHEVTVDQARFLELLPEVVRASDEPLADLASVPLLAVCKLAREHVKVVLSGEGSDEILGGYDFDTRQRAFAGIGVLKRLPQALQSVAQGVLGPVMSAPQHQKLKQALATPTSDLNRTIRAHMTRHFTQGDKTTLWPAGVGADSDRILDAAYEKLQAIDPLSQLLLLYQQSWLVEDLLMKADKMSMATSLELRVPFLDHRLVQWANRLPAAAKVAQLGFFKYETKSLLRQFAMGRVPNRIIERPKQGFPVPAYRWLANGLAPWADDLLTGNESRLKDAFAVSEMRSLLDAAKAGVPGAAHKTWLLLILELWLREWNAKLG